MCGRRKHQFECTPVGEWVGNGGVCRVRATGGKPFFAPHHDFTLGQTGTPKGVLHPTSNFRLKDLVWQSKGLIQGTLAAFYEVPSFAEEAKPPPSGHILPQQWPIGTSTCTQPLVSIGTGAIVFGQI